MPEALRRALAEARASRLLNIGIAGSFGLIAELSEAWYGIDSVVELSRLEAGVIADRIVPLFAQTRNLPADHVEQLHAAVVDALHNCFVTHSLSSGPSLGEFRLACVRIVQESVDPILGTDSARTLAELLNDDMSQDHRHS